MCTTIVLKKKNGADIGVQHIQIPKDPAHTVEWQPLAESTASVQCLQLK